MAPFDNWRAKRSVGSDRDTLPSSEHDSQGVIYSDFPSQQPDMNPTKWNKDEPGAEQLPCEMHERSSTTSASDLPMNEIPSKSNGQKKNDESCGQGIVNRPEHRSAPCVERTTLQKQHSKSQGGRPSFNKAMHEKWGSVFVVEGSQRRRKMPVRKRSMEDQDSPKAREEQVRLPQPYTLWQTWKFHCWAILFHIRPSAYRYC